MYTIRRKIRKIVDAKNFRCHATVRKAASCKPVRNVRAYPAYVAGNRKGIFRYKSRISWVQILSRKLFENKTAGYESVLSLCLVLVCVCGHVLDCLKQSIYRSIHPSVRPSVRPFIHQSIHLYLCLVPFFNSANFILFYPHNSLWLGSPCFISLLVSSGYPCNLSIPKCVLVLYYILAK